MTARRFAEVAASIGGAALVLAALVIIWVARISVGHDVYVSELGAAAMPTAREFEVALLMIVAGGSLIAFAGRDVRSRIRFLALWTPAVSLWISCGFFFAASQVTCTYTCPVPYGATFDWQDFGHTLFATCAFIVACWAMLQAAFAQGHRVLALFSLVMGAAVGAIAAVGGILALARFQVGFGSRLELVATSLAIAWVAVYGVVIAARRMRDSDRRSDGDQRRDMRSSSSVASPTST